MLLKTLTLFLWTLHLRYSECSKVIDFADRAGIYINDYCPATLCPNGTHTMCLYYNPNSKIGPRCSGFQNKTMSTQVAEKILDLINEIRGNVAMGKETGQDNIRLPRGYGLHKLRWDPELAVFAQVMADTCIFRHDLCRATKQFKSPGQVISVVRFTKEDWMPVAHRNLFKESGLTEQKIEYAASEACKNWYQQKQYVNEDMIYSVPDWLNIDPRNDVRKPEAKIFLQLIDGHTTHIGCGLSAYKEYSYNKEGNSDNIISNLVHIVCNFSSEPKNATSVYRTKPFRNQCHGPKCPPRRCDCPDGTAADERCLCTSGPPSRCGRNKSCNPAVVLLPIFTVEDAPLPAWERQKRLGKPRLIEDPQPESDFPNEITHFRKSFNDEEPIAVSVQQQSYEQKSDAGLMGPVSLGTHGFDKSEGTLMGPVSLGAHGFGSPIYKSKRYSDVKSRTFHKPFKKTQVARKTQKYPSNVNYQYEPQQFPNSLNLGFNHVIPPRNSVSHLSVASQQSNVNPVSYFSLSTQQLNSNPGSHFTLPTQQSHVNPVSHFALPTQKSNVNPVSHFALPTQQSHVNPVSHFALPSQQSHVNPVSHFTLPTQQQSYVKTGPKVSIFARAPKFELPTSHIIALSDVKNIRRSHSPIKLDVAPRKDFSTSHKILETYRIGKHVITTRIPVIEHKKAIVVPRFKARFKIQPTITKTNSFSKQMYVNDSIQTTESKNMNRYMKNKFHYQGFGKVDEHVPGVDDKIFNEEADKKLMSLLDTLEQEVKHIELDVNEKEIFDAKLRKIYGKLLGRSPMLLTRVSNVEDEKPEPFKYDTEADEHPTFDSVKDPYTRNFDKQMYETEDRVRELHSKGRNTQKNMYVRPMSRNQNSLTPYNDRNQDQLDIRNTFSDGEFKPKPSFKNYANEKRIVKKNIGHFRVPANTHYNDQKETKNEFLNAHKRLEDDDFEKGKPRFSFDDTKRRDDLPRFQYKKKSNHALREKEVHEPFGYGYNDASNRNLVNDNKGKRVMYSSEYEDEFFDDDPLGPERRKYYQDKLDNLERRFRSEHVTRHRAEHSDRETERAQRTVRGRERMQQLQSNHPKKSAHFYVPDRARSLHGF